MRNNFCEFRDIRKTSQSGARVALHFQYGGVRYYAGKHQHQSYV